MSASISTAPNVDIPRLGGLQDTETVALSENTSADTPIDPDNDPDDEDDAIETGVSEQVVQDPHLASDVGIILCGGSELLESACRLAEMFPELKIVCVATASGFDGDNEALPATVDYILLKDAGVSLGRARNAGYRRLKKLLPGMRFVQFIEPGAALSTQWFNDAMRFFERRPEVAAVEGDMATIPENANLLTRLWEMSGVHEPGEMMTVGESFLVRTDAFEAAGGFRGDAPSVETADLCIRLRKRGAHVWRLESPMATREPPVRTLGQWFGGAAKNGASYAFGAGLHGAGPEKFHVQEQSRALIWGAILPLFLMMFVAGMGVLGFFLYGAREAVFAVLAALAIGFSVYGARILVIAVRRGPFNIENWLYALLNTVGLISEAAGVVGVWTRFRGTRRRKTA